MPAKTFLGIDPSLSSTGIVVVQNDYVVASCTVGYGLTKAASKLDKLQRVQHICDNLETVLLATKPAVVAIEGIAFGSNLGSAHERAYLWWSLVDTVYRSGKSHCIEVAPRSLKLRATGSGKADKEDMVAAIPEHVRDGLAAQHGGKSLYDVADAWWLATEAQLWQG